MRSFWNGSISFGLINIPVSVYPATKPEQLSFHFLHEKDLGRIHNERVCEKCGATVPYESVVRGYEYEKDQYTPVTKEDLESAAIEGSKTIDILDFVDDRQIDPMYFDKPYYLVPDKKGEKAYALLREAMKKAGKAGVAKVVFHTRENLAAVRPVGKALMLEVMHFAAEFKKPEEMQLPGETIRVDKRELQMAEELVESMSAKFDPEKYKSTYHENLNRMIEEKMEGKAPQIKAKKRQPANVIDIMSKLKESLAQKGRRTERKKTG